ncbi:MAG: helix-turn-helix domain-containing protein [bacterium]|nr:helix-turn-helix domain-containing protein [bacterium]
MHELTTREVMDALGVSRQRVRLLRLMGKIRGHQTRFGWWLYDRDSVLEYARQRDAWKKQRVGDADDE